MRGSVPAHAGVRALRAHRLLMRLAFGAGHIFAWVIVFRGFYLSNGNLEATLIGVAILYSLAQGIAFILTPLSGIALRHGIRRALVYGTLTAAFAFVCMSLLFTQAISDDFAFGMIVSFVILMGLHRALYWIPYATAAAEMHAGRSQLFWLRETLIALMPLLAGVLITIPRGPQILLSLISGSIILAMFPLTMIPESYERFEWGYRETFSQLFSPFNRGPLWLSLFDGIQGVTLLLIWPLAAFIIIGQSFSALGVILSATLCIAFVGRPIVRRILRTLRADRSTTVVAVIAFSSWVLRLSAGSPLQVAVADVYYHSGISPRRFSVDASASDQSADGGHFVDEYTALKEMGMALGRILACAFLALIALIVNAQSAFALTIILAAFSAAGSVVLSRRLSRQV
ncbi:hypothetical protein A2765_00750 [Candidatus Kaiserbacteria bacterium RIFCSPHIGHO2_01_FULL_56_24]|uniref:Major facilitator superfamily (MFS) profile domain-containing protein n=1 Tax=Candidatus Kaiserbacteria bacterium RIFCSPHIGHO2_01_FULL_56_24 TaxID=1798487 RepID=A0A1F6DEX2_9BACT|nr:MAG: hypothetical protein A2765_00750 [Candidatus Kaiserbacteria bacterium RIFCSPHIGHO2_01_FULL_56_24]